MQILASADNTSIMGRTLTVMMEASLSSERESKKMGLKINKEKMMFIFGQTNNILQPEICINEYISERVDNFTHLSS